MAEEMSQEVLDVLHAKIASVPVTAGDVIVITASRPLTVHAANRIKALMVPYFPDCTVVVLDNTLSLEALSKGTDEPTYNPNT